MYFIYFGGGSSILHLGVSNHMASISVSKNVLRILISRWSIEMEGFTMIQTQFGE